MEIIFNNFALEKTTVKKFHAFGGIFTFFALEKNNSEILWIF